jgi:hypothetical protein
MTATPIVTYECRITEGKIPQLCKVVTSGELSIETALNADNKEEFESISDELVLEHINNVVDYMKNIAPTMSITPIADSPTQTWPLNGFKDFVEAGQSLDKWWWAAHNREEPEDDHEHDENGDHV